MGSIQRGGMVAKNDNGTLERVDGTNTYIGSATLENGKVITKRFRGNVPDEQKIVERWLKWQGRKTEDEEMAEIIKVDDGSKTPKCPFSGCECNAKCPLWSEAQRVCSLKLAGIGLSYVAANLMNLKVDEELELIALAIAESGKKTDKPKAEPARELTATDGVEFFLAAEVEPIGVPSISDATYDSISVELRAILKGDGLVFVPVLHIFKSNHSSSSISSTSRNQDVMPP